MSDPVKSTEQLDPDGTSQSSLGRLLTAAREEKGLNIEDVTKQLRMSAHQIKALENDDFRALPNPMYTRGFIRNYARLLQLDPELLLHMYSNHVPTQTLHSISLPSENIPIFNQSKKPWLSYVIASAVIAIALGSWLIYMGYAENHADKAVATQLPTASHKHKPKAEAATTEPLPMPALPAAERETVESTVTEGTPPAAVTRNVQQSAPSGIATLKLTFSDHTWVSVTDRNNKEIFNKTESAGSEDIVQGQPPFKIIIGNVSGSKLVFNDKPVDLVPYTKLNVAHLTLE
jgi:cytoskeleton protein RodZ